MTDAAHTPAEADAVVAAELRRLADEIAPEPYDWEQETERTRGAYVAREGVAKELHTRADILDGGTR